MAQLMLLWRELLSAIYKKNCLFAYAIVTFDFFLLLNRTDSAYTINKSYFYPKEMKPDGTLTYQLNNARWTQAAYHTTNQFSTGYPFVIFEAKSDKGDTIEQAADEAVLETATMLYHMAHTQEFKSSPLKAVNLMSCAFAMRGPVATVELVCYNATHHTPPCFERITLASSVCC